MTFRYGIQVSLEELPTRMPVVLRGSFEEVTDTAAELGYDGIEFYLHSPREHDGALYKKKAADKGLGFSSICTGLELLYNGLGLTVDSVDIRKRAVERLKEHLDLANELDCSVVIGTMRGNIPHPNKAQITRQRLVDALGELADHADSTGGQIVVENILQYISNWLNTLDEVGNFLEEVNRPNVSMHIDTHSMHMEETDPFAAIRRWADRIGYVHFSDANRAYPGGGCIDFMSYYHALFDAGYSGWITIESQPFPTGRDCAQRGIQYLKNVEAAARIELLPVLDKSSIRF
ncbi:sugar phosphate isomerase/epimerase [Schaalia sp. ZJ405]|uniref:sugar phosphate isomerase/epimerase family protein n=1 Tax=Schaalia sp. ZJ405 TaxID=2709403 RepID=UPI0013ED77BD|nr:sugar phosphate isomerase/epimerase family protein [Schaalia sp. ZJ405]QPK81265.1 sugar phosphate isomerase/epimerase [Schaalia sp. ZJ405]